MDKYTKAEADRQRILDMLNVRPMTVRELEAAFDDDAYNDERLSQIMIRIESLDEAYRTQDGTSKSGRPCALWHARVKTTVSADDIKAHLTGNLKGPGKGRKIVRAGVRRPTAKAVRRVFGGLYV